MKSATPMRLKKHTPLWPPTFSNREKTDAGQKQGDNSQARTVLSLFSQKPQPRCSAENHKRADPKLTKLLSFRDSVSKNNYDNSDYDLDLGRAGVLVNSPDSCGFYTGGLPRPLKSNLTPSCPHLGRRWFYQPPKKKGKKSVCCSCQECLQLRCIKLSSNAIFIVCYMKQSAFHRLSNAV